jgi:hypothetical protein
MAATTSVNVTPQEAFSFGSLRARIVDVAPAAADYPTAGYAISANSVNLSQIFGVIVLGLDAAVVTTGVHWQFNINTGKLQAFVSNGASPAFLNEAPAATDVSGQKVRLLIIGV